MNQSREVFGPQPDKGPNHVKNLEQIQRGLIVLRRSSLPDMDSRTPTAIVRLDFLEDEIPRDYFVTARNATTGELDERFSLVTYGVLPYLGDLASYHQWYWLENTGEIYNPNKFRPLHSHRQIDDVGQLQPNVEIKICHQDKDDPTIGVNLATITKPPFTRASAMFIEVNEQLKSGKLFQHTLSLEDHAVIPYSLDWAWNQSNWLEW